MKAAYKVVLAVIVVAFVSVTLAKAAIPDSTSNTISVCRNNLTGALRAIDAQAGQSCNSGQTLLKWGGEQTAVAYVNAVGADDGSLVLSLAPTLSRNISNFKQASIEGLGGAGFCIDVPFQVRYGSANGYYAVTPSTTEYELIHAECGASYDAFFTPGEQGHPIYFTE